MLHNITTMKDVQTFIDQIAQEIDDFHPLQDFNSYVYPDSYMRRYTEEEAEIRNKYLDSCFDVCAKQEADFFTFLIEVFHEAVECQATTL